MADDAAIADLTQVASKLGPDAWSQILSSLEGGTRDQLAAALNDYKDEVEAKEDEQAVPKDPNKGFGILADMVAKHTKALRMHRKKIREYEYRIKGLESGVAAAGGSVRRGARGAGAVPKYASRKPSKKTQAQAVAAAGEEPVDSPLSPQVDQSRKKNYYFGNRRIPFILPSTGYPTPKDAKAPVRGNLNMEYAYGYNGNDTQSRQNLFLSNDGTELIYHIAATAVVHNIADNTQKHFTKHNDDISCICLDPREGSTLVATGQVDPKDFTERDMPKIYVWDYTTCAKVKLIKNVHWGQVLKLRWSKQSGNLFSIGGDEEQTLKIWPTDNFDDAKAPVKCLMQTPTYKEPILGLVVNPYKPAKDTIDELVIFGKRKLSFGVIQASKGKKGLEYRLKMKQVSSSINMMKEIKKNSKLTEKVYTCVEFLPDGRYVVGTQSGCLYMLHRQKVLCRLPVHGTAVGDVVLMGNDILSAGFDEKLKRCSIQKDNLKLEWSSDKLEVIDHDFVMQPRALVYDQNAGTIYCGAKTNQIISYEMKSGEVAVVTDGHDGQVWGLATHPTKNVFMTGGWDNAIKIWNADTHQCEETFEWPVDEPADKQQVHTAAWSPDGKLIAVGTEDSKIHIFTYEPRFGFATTFDIPPKSKASAKENVEYLRFSEDGGLLAAAHMDSNLYIFTVQQRGETVTLEAWSPLPHVAAPTNIQFSADSTMIKSLTRDYEVAHWQLDKYQRKASFVPWLPDPDEVQWGGDPLIAGWDVQGLYQKGWDGTDLNDATLTSDSGLIASGDDFGVVRLHNYPAVDNDPNCNRKYLGHSAFVVGVEFLRSDSHLLTCGGGDMAIFQWKLNKSE